MTISADLGAIARSDIAYTPAKLSDLGLADSVVNLLLDDLIIGDSPRSGGTQDEHIRNLAESVTSFPPIVVHRATMRVIDGVHRIRAARLRSDRGIDSIFFEGSLEEAYVLSIKLNVVHGLPLSLYDRKAAAIQILRFYPEWSNRGVAAAAGISDKTVAQIRMSLDNLPESMGRIARNGVWHRGKGAVGRSDAAKLFIEQPDISPQTVAQQVGISLSTAKDVRYRLRRGESPVSKPLELSVRGRDRVDKTVDHERKIDGSGEGIEADMAAANTVAARDLVRKLRSDPSLRMTESGRSLLRALEISSQRPEGWKGLAKGVPAHCVPAVIELAQECSRNWLKFASLLGTTTPYLPATSSPRAASLSSASNVIDI